MWFGSACFCIWFAVTWYMLKYVEDDFLKEHGRKMDGRESSAAILACMMWIFAIPFFIGFMIDGEND